MVSMVTLVALVSHLSRYVAQLINKGALNMIYTGKILQIIPAPENLYIRYHDELEGYYYVLIVCTALCEDGKVRFLDTDSFGDIGLINDEFKSSLYRYCDKKQDYIAI